MSKYVWILPVLILFLSVSAGCKSQNVRGGRLIAGPAAADIVNYVNQDLLGIAELEKRALESYASVTGENYTNDQRVYEELKTFVAPTYRRFLEELRRISPKNSELRKVHGLYIQGAESQYEGFITKMAGIERNDEGVIIQGNQKIDKGRMEIERWDIELKKLFKEHGVAEIIE